ncbi:MAG: hypothetical protein V9H69_11885 [Anaerolineae bacterium]
MSTRSSGWAPATPLCRRGHPLQGQSQSVLVFYGDMPLVTQESMQAAAGPARNATSASGGVLSLLTFESDNAARLWPHCAQQRRRRAGHRRRGRLHSRSNCMITELNPGLYCYDADWLWRSLDEITVSPKGRVLSDRPGGDCGAHRDVPVLAHKVSDPVEMLGINTRVHLAEAEAVLRARINRRWMEAGVTLIDPATTYIDDTVEIGRDTLSCCPACICAARASIGEDCRIGPDTTVVDTIDRRRPAVCSMRCSKTAAAGGSRRCRALCPPARRRPPGAPASIWATSARSRTRTWGRASRWAISATSATPTSARR